MLKFLLSLGSSLAGPWAWVLANWKLVVGSLALGAAVFYVWHWHTSAIDDAVEARDVLWMGKIETEQKRQRGIVSDWVLEMAARDEKARELYEAKKGGREIVYHTLEREVPVYVTPLADSRCTVPAGFVLHHDAAAAARPTALLKGPGELVDADSGLALSAVERTVTQNYAACTAAIDEVTEWRRWYPVARDSYEQLRARLSQPQEK